MEELYLKKANVEDAKVEYEAIKRIKEEENGFKNQFYNVDFETFKNESLIKMINGEKGINLSAGYVPQTYYFIYKGDIIVGLVKLRHYLNERLENGPGHLGIGIIEEYRGNGYANIGIKLAIEKAKEIVKEDELYVSCYKTNIASLKAQLKNGAYIHHESEDEYFNRIKIR